LDFLEVTGIIRHPGGINSVLVSVNPEPFSHLGGRSRDVLILHEKR